MQRENKDLENAMKTNDSVHSSELEDKVGVLECKG